MSAQQELISAVRSMQANAQANLPVIPNNGNPNGAYNAPRAVRQAPVRNNQNDLSWLQPSPAMQQLQQRMSERQQYLDNMLNQIRQQPAPAMNEPAPIPQQLPQMPVLPNMPVTNMPVARTPGIVLPTTDMNTGIIPQNVQRPMAVIPQPRMM